MKSRQIVFLPGLRRSAGGTWKINPAFIPVDSKSTRLSSLLSGTPVPLAVDRNLPAPGSQNKALALRETSRGQMKDGRRRTRAEPGKWGQLRVWDALCVCVCVCVCVWHHLCVRWRAEVSLREVQPKCLLLALKWRAVSKNIKSLCSPDPRWLIAGSDCSRLLIRRYKTGKGVATDS